MNNSVNAFLSGHGNFINKIKLKELLALKNTFSADDKISTLFPPIEIGSITLVDQIVLLSLLKIIAPKKILEVGTYLGYSTTLLTLNSDAEIISLDLPSDLCYETQFNNDEIFTNGDVNDDYLRYMQSIEGAVYLKNLTQEECARVSLVKKDSTKVDFLGAFGELDYVFIDGGHTYDIIESDTENALRAVKKGVIIWHDYSSDIHSDVTRYLDSRNDMRIFHIINSLCAFAFIGFGAED